MIRRFQRVFVTNLSKQPPLPVLNSAASDQNLVELRNKLHTLANTDEDVDLSQVTGLFLDIRSKLSSPSLYSQEDFDNLISIMVRKRRPSSELLSIVQHMQSLQHQGAPVSLTTSSVNLLITGLLKIGDLESAKNIIDKAINHGIQVDSKQFFNITRSFLERGQISVLNARKHSKAAKLDSSHLTDIITAKYFNDLFT